MSKNQETTKKLELPISEPMFFFKAGDLYEPRIFQGLVLFNLLRKPNI